MLTRNAPTGRIAPNALGLVADPFPRDPAQGRFVATAMHAAVRDALRDWIDAVSADPARPDRLALVTGDEGSGKTALLAHLERDLDNADRRIVTIPEALAHRSDAQLLKGILAAFGADPTGRTGLELRGELATALDGLATSGIRPGLVIDGAHIKGSQLELLRNILRDAAASGLWIALFGLPDLRDRVQRRRSLRGLLGPVLALDPLDAADMDRLLDGRIAAARADDATGAWIEPAARVALRDWAGGNPARLLRIASAALATAIDVREASVTATSAQAAARALTIAEANAAWDDAAPVQTRMPLLDDAPAGASPARAQQSLWDEGGAS